MIAAIIHRICRRRGSFDMQQPRATQPLILFTLAHLENIASKPGHPLSLSEPLISEMA